MRPKRILVVDDDPQNLKLARVLLGAEGYDIETAPTAEDALRVIDRVTPELILMDVQLPGVDGLTLTRQLKSHPVHRSIIVVVFTASAMKADAERAFAAGCDGYLSKPADIATLRATVADHLARGPRPAGG